MQSAQTPWRECGSAGSTFSFELLLEQAPPARVRARAGLPPPSRPFSPRPPSPFEFEQVLERALAYPAASRDERAEPATAGPCPEHPPPSRPFSPLPPSPFAFKQALDEYGLALRAYRAFWGEHKLFSRFPPWAVDDLALPPSPPLPPAVTQLLSGGFAFAA